MSSNDGDTKDYGLKRLFIGLAVPAEALPNLVYWADSQKPVHPGLDWIHYANWHITLHFLGQTSSERLVEIAKSLRDVAANTDCFKLDIAGIRCLPNNSATEYLFANVSEHPALIELHSRVGRALALDAGDYMPHISLARVDRKDLSELATSEQMRFGSLSANQIQLYESRDSNYLRLESFPLRPQ